MLKLLICVFTIFLLGVVAGCHSFENNFYEAINQRARSAIKTHNHNTKFDLAALTDFKWDSVLVIYGNESVPVDAEEIQRSLGRATVDLDLNKDRFYFLKHDKSIVEYEIETGLESDRPSFEIEYCLSDSLNPHPWLSRSSAILPWDITAER